MNYQFIEGVMRSEKALFSNRLFPRLQCKGRPKSSICAVLQGMEGVKTLPQCGAFFAVTLQNRFISQL